LSGPKIVTFGCRLNAYESEAMRRHAENTEFADAIIVNTCAVTAEAVRQARQAIRKLRRENPGVRIVVTGCAAQVAPDSFADMAEVDLVLGNGEKLKPENYRFAPDGKLRVSDIMTLKETAPQFVSGFEGRARAFLQIQNGCDHRCTFCIIPFGRGNSRSVGMDAVIEEAKTLAANGYAEIVLTGVDLTSYGADLPGTPSLGALVRRLLQLAPEVKRLRLSSIDSIEADAELMRAIAEEDRLMPHFHISAQAGDDMILKRMKRRHSRADTVRFCEEVRRLRPDVAFGADLIAGFPTETDEMFENTLRLADEAGFSYLHVFPFSPRPGTPAARMPQVARETVKARARILRAKGASLLQVRLESLVGSVQDLLIEKPGLGRTPCYAEAEFSGPEKEGPIKEGPIKEGIVRAKIVKAGPNRLHAELMP
jgi:threonylcarbamoyladenosine tRNA methylthiotransferase MtaB